MNFPLEVANADVSKAGTIGDLSRETRTSQRGAPDHTISQEFVGGPLLRWPLQGRHRLGAEPGFEIGHAMSPHWPGRDLPEKHQSGVLWPAPTTVAAAGGSTAPEAVVRMFFRIAGLWNLTLEQCRLLLDLETDSAVRQLKQGLIKLQGRDRQDRVANVIAIYIDVHQLLRSEDEEQAWFYEHREELGTRPVDLLLAGRLEDLIDLRRYVEYVAGR